MPVALALAQCSNLPSIWRFQANRQLASYKNKQHTGVGRNYYASPRSSSFVQQLTKVEAKPTGTKKTATNWRKTKQNESEMWMWMNIKWIELKWKSTWRKLFFNFRLLSGCFYLFFPYVPPHSLHIVGPLLNAKRGEFRHKISPRLSIRSSPLVRHFTCTCISLFSFVLKKKLFVAKKI